MSLQHKQEEADEVKRKLAEESRSDHIALHRAFEVHTQYIPILFMSSFTKGVAITAYQSHLCIYICSRG